MTELERFLEARDFLLDARGDYHRAVSEFRWPALESFNWASDFFDVIAAANDAPALVIVEPSGTVTRRTYAELSSRSSQVANLLSALGITRGDRVLVMLGNELALWEVVLAVIKLGAVMIPTTPLLAGADLADRLTRSSARILVANDTGAAVLNALPDASREGLTLIGVGSPGKGWIAFDDADLEEAVFSARAPTASSDPLIEYFTSGTTTRPKLVRHTHASYPVGHLSTMFWLGLRPADIHWTISSPGWAKHAWGCFFAPFNAQACVFVYNYERFDGRAVLETLVEHEVTTLCTPPTVWRFLIQEPSRWFWRSHGFL